VEVHISPERLWDYGGVFYIHKLSPLVHRLDLMPLRAQSAGLDLAWAERAFLVIQRRFKTLIEEQRQKDEKVEEISISLDHLSVIFIFLGPAGGLCLLTFLIETCLGRAKWRNLCEHQ